MGEFDVHAFGIYCGYETPWRRDPVTPLMEHHEGVPWHQAPPPGWRHAHRAQTRAWIALEFVERCPCGATRISPFRTWTPEREPRVDSPTWWQRLIIWLNR
jgi:hypothetical protein